MGGRGIAPALSSGSEYPEEEEADTLAERTERAGEGDRPLPRFPPERDLSLPDDRLRQRSGWENSRARSHRPGEVVAEAAPMRVTTPGAGTHADEPATGAADVTGAAGPSSTPAPVTPAAVNKDPTAAFPLVHGPRQTEEQPDELLERGRGKRDGTTRNAGAGSTVDPELP